MPSNKAKVSTSSATSDAKALKVKKATKVKKVLKAVKKTTKIGSTKSSTSSVESVVLRKRAVSPKPSVPSVVAKPTGLTVKVFDTSGKSAGVAKLPEKVFGVKVNKQLLAQALHIYFTNSSTHTAHTKTRAEVRGGGRKPWKQKGTGNARAGSRRSPLWVGGGITFGPRSRNVKLDLPKKMKNAALISSLSAKAQDGKITIIANLEKIQPKTKIMANLLTKIEAKTPTLLVVKEKSKSVNLASRNIPQTMVETPQNLNAFVVWQNKNILISKEALASLAESGREKLA